MNLHASTKAGWHFSWDHDIQGWQNASSLVKIHDQVCAVLHIFKETWFKHLILHPQFNHQLNRAEWTYSSLRPVRWRQSLRMADVFKSVVQFNVIHVSKLGCTITLTRSFYLQKDCTCVYIRCVVIQTDTWNHQMVHKRTLFVFRGCQSSCHQASQVPDSGECTRTHECGTVYAYCNN